MKVGSDGIFIEHPFISILLIIASAKSHFAEGGRSLPKERLATVVFVADNSAKGVAVDRYIANESFISANSTCVTKT